jgi:hypothetical protein
MRAPMAVIAALAGGLLFLPSIQGPASSAPINLKTFGSTSGSVILVGHGSGGGPAFAAGGGGGGRVGGGFARGGSGSNFASRSGPHVGAYSGPRYASRDFNRSWPRSDMRHGNAQAYNRDRSHDHGDRNRFDHHHFAERGHDHDFDRFHNRHRVFRNGVWVWVYGPDYYAYGNDCWWLRQQALATGSPYWWSRYSACVAYY